MDYYECRKCHLIKVGSDFYERDGEPDPTWCKQCYRDWYVGRSGGLVEKTCEFCGTVFQCTARQAKRQRFCSRPCKGKARNEAARVALKASKPKRICLHCTTPLDAEKRTDALFCTDKCRTSASNLIKRINARSEYYGVPGIEGEYFNRAFIIVRDNYTRHICGGTVDVALSPPELMAPSIDHVIPFIFGGTNDLANLKLAHLQCNTDKGRTEKRCYAPS